MCHKCKNFRTEGHGCLCVACSRCGLSTPPQAYIWEKKICWNCDRKIKRNPEEAYPIDSMHLRILREEHEHVSRTAKMYKFSNSEYLMRLHRAAEDAGMESVNRAAVLVEASRAAADEIGKIIEAAREKGEDLPRLQAARGLILMALGEPIVKG
jgi:hypothetical protein